MISPTKIIIAWLLLYLSVFSADITVSDSWQEGLTARTISAGTNRAMLFVSVSEEENSGLTQLDSVKLGTVKLTFFGSYQVGTTSFRNRIEQWYLLDADIPGGSVALTVFWDNTPNSFSYNSVVFAGVDQTTPISDTASVIDNSTFVQDSVDLVVTAGAYSVVAVQGSSSGRTVTWTGAIEEYELTLSAASGALADTLEGGAGTNTVAATLSSSVTRGLIAGCVMNPVAAPPTDIGQVIIMGQ